MDALAVNAATELLARRRARQSMHGYAAYTLPEGQTVMPHHALVCAALDAVHSGECDRLIVMMPPGSAKSTYGSTMFPAYFLGRNPQLNVLAASHTMELAERFGRRVRNEVASPRHRMLFGSGIADDSQAAGRWETDQGGEFFAAGVGGTIAGRRADLAIIDDPVRSREDADSERVRETIWQWWINDLLTRLKPGGRVVLIMTRWHEDDLAGRVLQLQPGRWKVLKLPMEARENDPLGRAPGERLWPEWFTDEMVRDAKRDARAWSSLYQQEPRPKEGAEFKLAWVQRYSLAPRGMNKVILVDPASGKARERAKKAAGKGAVEGKNDWTTMWVVALATDGNAYLVDGVRDKLNLPGRADTLFELHRKHKPLQTRYEDYGLQSDIEHIQGEQEKRQYRFKITPVGGQVQKEARIRRLIPWFEHGKLYLPLTMPFLDSTGQVRDLMKEFLDEEFTAFPVGVHDDMLDGLARLAEPTLKLPWPGERNTPDADGTAAFGVLDEIAGY